MNGEFTYANVHYIKDGSKKPVAKAIYFLDKATYSINANYLVRKLKENEQVTVIYDTSNLANAAVYTWWGYWLQWDELLTSLLIPLILFYAAKSITNNPTPEALIKELEMNKPIKRRKYD